MCILKTETREMNHRPTARIRSPPPPKPFSDRAVYPIVISRIPDDFDLESVSLDNIAPDPITAIKSNISTQSTRYATPLWHKSAITSLAGWCTVCASVSSTSLLGASEEIANDLGTTKTVVTLSTAGLLFAMALSGFIWSPLQAILGRRVTYNAALVALLCFTVGAGLAQTTALFVTFRVLSGFQGCYFQITGQRILSQFFPPSQRGTAMGYYLAITMLGSPLGPLVAGIMVTFAHWRSVLWLQAGMIGVGLVLSVFFIPAAARDSGVAKLNLGGLEALSQFNPLPVFQVMAYPNVLLTHLSCGLLGVIQYSLLASPRHVLKVHYALTSSLEVGLFYISPVFGFLLGTIVGGWYSDRTVHKWTYRRVRFLPQDRLRSGTYAFFGLIPVAVLLYGWGIHATSSSTDRRTLVLPIVASFFIAAGLLVAFASLNTYCNEAIPEKQREVVGGKYFIQFSFTAMSTAAAVPIIEAIGIGPSSIIGTVVVVLTGMITLATAGYGEDMQNWRDDRRSQ